MIKPAFVGGLVAIAAVVAASAEDFPLTFRSIPANGVMSFLGGYGITAPFYLIDKTVTVSVEFDLKPLQVAGKPLAVQL
jgi:hypothetical protein